MQGFTLQNTIHGLLHFHIWYIFCNLSDTNNPNYDATFTLLFQLISTGTDTTGIRTIHRSFLQAEKLVHGQHLMHYPGE